MAIKKLIAGIIVATTIGIGSALYLHQLNKSRVNPVSETQESNKTTIHGTTEQMPQPQTLEDYMAPRLTDNAQNKANFRTYMVPYEEVYLAFCEGGTDGNGKIIKPCTKDRRIDPKIFPDAIKFVYFSTDENDPNIHTYKGYIPNIPSAEEATYMMVGYKIYGNVRLEDMPEYNAAVYNTNPKSKVHSKRPEVQPKKPEEKKPGIMKRIFPKND